MQMEYRSAVKSHKLARVDIYVMYVRDFVIYSSSTYSFRFVCGGGGSGSVAREIFGHNRPKSNRVFPSPTGYMFFQKKSLIL